MELHILQTITTQPGHSWFPFRRDISVRREQLTSDAGREGYGTMRDMLASSPAQPRGTVMTLPLLSRPMMIWRRCRPRSGFLANQENISTTGAGVGGRLDILPREPEPPQLLDAAVFAFSGEATSAVASEGHLDWIIRFHDYSHAFQQITAFGISGGTAVVILRLRCALRATTSFQPLAPRPCCPR